MNRAAIIVTGASRGLGAAVALEAAGLGAAVALNARSRAGLEAVAEKIRAAGGSALVVPGDVSRQEVCRALVEEAAGAFGRIDALVNNAGILEPLSPLAEADPAAWEKNLAINLLGPMMLTQAALPHLRRRQGRLINVSSGAATYALPGWGAYCVAKAALNQLNRVVAVEEESVVAVAVRPGIVDTQMQALIRQEGSGSMRREDHARFVGHHREGRLLPPELPGRAIAVLALYAPPEWSGEFLSWDDGQVQALVESVAG